jgi:hypothetical protein
MAACGCLRICNRTAGLGDARLKWAADGGSYTPILSVPATPDELICALLKDVKNAADRFSLTWSGQIKSAKKDQFVHAMKTACKNADEESLRWFAAFGTELCVDDNETIEPTPFDMSVARQRFLADALKLAASLAGPESEADKHYREALFGPWLYRDDQHSLGWDPSTMKLGAFTHKAPTGMPNNGVRAAVWLAFESLPLFPCFFNERLRTRAFRTRDRTEWFHWPVWDCPLSLEAIRTLLSWPGILEDLSAREKRDELEARGIIAVYKSAQFKPNKYLTSFRMPELAYARQTSAGAIG